MKLTIQGMIIGIVAVTLLTSCSTREGVGTPPQVSPPTVSSTPNSNSQQSGNVEQPGDQLKLTQAPFSLPSGYQAVETTAFKFAVPKDWNVKKGEASDSLLFQKDGKDVGETETLGWFNSESWMNIKPNHTDQTDFQEIKDILSMEDIDVHIYRIQLIHTKPAAEKNPNWKYNETRWYVAVKDKERAYGFYFSSDQVDESTMKMILSSFRLKT